MVKNIALELVHLNIKSDLMRELGKTALNIQLFINGLQIILADQINANIVGRSAIDSTGLIKITNIDASEKIGLGSALNAITIWTIDRYEKFTGNKAIMITNEKTMEKQINVQKGEKRKPKRSTKA